MGFFDWLGDTAKDAWNWINSDNNTPYATLGQDIKRFDDSNDWWEKGDAAAAALLDISPVSWAAKQVISGQASGTSYTDQLGKDFEELPGKAAAMYQDPLTGASSLTTGGATPLPMAVLGAAQLLTAPFDGDVSFGDAWTRFWSGSLSGVGAVGAGAGVATDVVPGGHQIMEADNWLYHNGVSRPLSTVNLSMGNMVEEMMQGKPKSSNPLDVWRKAWNDSENVSAGQSAVFNFSRIFAAASTDSDEAYKTEVSTFDPRTTEGRVSYTGNAAGDGSTWRKWASGSLDFSSSLLLDPLNVIAPEGKIASAGKLAVAPRLTPEFKAAGKLEAWAADGKVNRLWNIAGDAPTQEQFRSTSFAETAYSGAVSSLLWDARKYGSFNDFNNILQAYWGDGKAFARIASDSPVYADGMLRRFGLPTLNEATNRIGLTDAATESSVAQSRTTTAALMDAIWKADENNVFARTQGAGVNQPLPSVSKWAQLKTGAHYSLLYTPTTIVDPEKASLAVRLAAKPVEVAGRVVVGGLRKLMPTQGFAPRVNLTDETNAINYFRSNIERAGMSRWQTDMWVSAFAKASTVEARHAVIEAAEARALAEAGAKWGQSVDAIKKLMPAIVAGRRSLNAALNRSRQYVPDSVREAARKAEQQGDMVKAEKLKIDAEDLEERIKQGLDPQEYLVTNDPDMNPMLVAGKRTQVGDKDVPALSSHLSPWASMTDWRAFDARMKWWTKGRPADPWDDVKAEWKDRGVLLKENVKAVGYRAAGTAVNTSVRSADFLQHVWKSLALARPAQVIRNLSDELLRSHLKWGALPMIANLTEGAANMRKNFLPRWGSFWEREQHARVAVQGGKSISVEQIDGTAVAAAPGMVRLGTGVDEFGKQIPTQAYSDYNAAFAHGLISEDNLMQLVDHHANTYGDLPPYLGAMYSFYKDSQLMKNASKAQKLQYENQYRQLVTDYVLASQGKAVYRNPLWQKHFVDTLLADNKFRAATAGGALRVDRLIDPFTGERPKGISNIEKSFTLLGGRNDRGLRRAVEFSPHPEGGEFTGDIVYKFINNNKDDLLRPDTLMYAYVTPEGSVRLQLARARETIGEGVVLKESAAERLMNWRRDKRQLGNKKIKIISDSGRSYEIDGGFGGDPGHVFRMRTQSGGFDEAYPMLQDNVNMLRLQLSAGEGWSSLTPDMPTYKTAFERALNLQLSNDALARKIMSGDLKTDADIKRWMDVTQDGRDYVAKMGFDQVNYTSRGAVVRELVDRYTPDLGTLDSQVLRAKALSGTATYEDVRKVFEDPEDLPEIHGASIDFSLGQGNIFETLNKWNEKAQMWLGAIPTDRFSRFPAANQRYQHYVQEGINLLELNSAGRALSPEVMTQIQNKARQLATRDVSKLLYDTAFHSDLAASMRFMVPFSSAILNAFKSYGYIAGENPFSVIRMYNYWMAPERNGMIQDEHGNLLHLKDGEEHWFGIDPVTGNEEEIDKALVGQQRYVHINLPDSLAHWVGRKVYGVDMKAPLRVDKDNLNVFLSLPTAGPMVAVPVNEFARANPEIGDNKIVQRFVLPYGPSSNGLMSAVPSTYRNGWNAFLADDSAQNSSQALAIFQAEMVNYAQGKRDKPPTVAEAKNMAEHLSGIRMLTSFAAPAAFQIQSPYQPYVDAYRQLRQADPKTADAVFYERYGEELVWFTAAVTRNNNSMPSSLNSFKAYNKYSELIDKYPELAGLIVGAEGAGEFSRSVYQWQMDQPVRRGSDQMMRERMQLNDSIADVQARYQWYKYSKMSDAVLNELQSRGLTSTTQKGAEDIAAYERAWIDKFSTWTNPSTGVQEISPWYKDYSTTDRSKMAGRLLALSDLADDPMLQQRDDIRGLSDYLSQRTSMRNEMRRRGFKSLDGKKAASLRGSWDNTVFSLKESNLSFGQLYSRWLKHDDVSFDIPRG